MHKSNEWFFRAGVLSRAPWQAVVDSDQPGWQHTGLRVAEITAGEQLAVDAPAIERVVVPLAGSFTVSVTAADGTQRVLDLAGRQSVFAGPTDVVYAGAGTALIIEGAGRVAVAEAPTTIVKPTHYVSRESVPVELRGAGHSSRQVHNLGMPGTVDAATILVCEVITPAENWSSYPPHKHDESIPGIESRLEEIYYFDAALTRGTPHPDASVPFGFFATYGSAAGAIDTAARVQAGDVALVPYGFHGPAAAAPGYDLYYLNVMAGPDEERVWRSTDDPQYAWVRSQWDDQAVDPRLPFFTSKGDSL